jgi:hypothetical protein
MSVSSLVRLALLAGLAFLAPQGEGREARALYERGDCAAALEACRERLVASTDDAGALALAGQLVFDDDPRMQPEYWREWAKKGRHPIVTLARESKRAARRARDRAREAVARRPRAGRQRRFPASRAGALVR